MEVDKIVELILKFAPQPVVLVLALLGALVVLGAAYVKLTPSQSDDAWWSKLEAMPVLGVVLKVLVRFSPLARKDEGK